MTLASELYRAGIAVGGYYLDDASPAKCFQIAEQAFPNAGEIMEQHP